MTYRPPLCVKHFSPNEGGAISDQKFSENESSLGSGGLEALHRCKMKRRASDGGWMDLVTHTGLSNPADATDTL